VRHVCLSGLVNRLRTVLVGLFDGRTGERSATFVALAHARWVSAWFSCARAFGSLLVRGFVPVTALPLVSARHAMLLLPCAFAVLFAVFSSRILSLPAPIRCAAVVCAAGMPSLRAACPAPAVHCGRGPCGVAAWLRMPCPPFAVQLRSPLSAATYVASDLPPPASLFWRSHWQTGMLGRHGTRRLTPYGSVLPCAGFVDMLYCNALTCLRSTAIPPSTFTLPVALERPHTYRLRCRALHAGYPLRYGGARTLR